MNQGMTVEAAETPGRRSLLQRITKRCVRALNDFQGRHSPIGIYPVFPEPRVFPFTAPLEASWQTLRRELDQVRREDVPTFHQISPDQSRISKGDNWKTFTFYVMGHRVDDNCAQCPETAALLDRMPGLQNAFFSILAPRYHIPPHCGPSRALLRVHLGLKLPADRDNCWIRVDDQIVRWEEGRVVVFDDTYEHEVRNDTDEERVVLFLDFDRPMDLPGRIVDGLLVRVMRATAYVRDPLRNLEAWRRQRATAHDD